MVIGIDAGPLLGQGGISRYVTPLIEALCARRDVSDVELVLRRSWRHHAGVTHLRRLAPVTQIAMPDRLLSMWWKHVQSPFPIAHALWNRFDLYLDTCLMPPVLGHGRVLAVVYDLIPLRLPDLFPDHERFRDKLEELCRRAALLIAISHRTKADLVELLGIDPGRVAVVYPGRTHGNADPDPVQMSTVLHRYGIAGPYVLYVGALGPHKNVTMLVQAYEQARRDGALQAKLVLVGGHEWGRATLQAIAACPAKRDIILTGFVPDEDLFCLYAGADLFVFPSWYEGFGLPVLEAMTYGVPVLVSDGGALPEVAGDAGVIVAPNKPETWAQELTRLMNNATVRQTLGERSRTQAGRFSWTQSAELLSTLFEQVHRGAG